MAPPKDQRRHQALDHALADDTVEDIWRPLACATSWLSTWRSRADATQATWAQERSKRPQRHPTQTPEHVAGAVVSLPLPVRHNGTGGRATAMRPGLAQQGIAPGPSRRPLSRMRRRQHTGVKERGSPASLVVCREPQACAYRTRCQRLPWAAPPPRLHPHGKAWNVAPPCDEDGTRAPRCCAVAANRLRGCGTRHEHGERTASSVWGRHGGAPAWDITSAHAAASPQCWNARGGKKAKNPLRG
jgi:hypothetical protein